MAAAPLSRDAFHARTAIARLLDALHERGSLVLHFEAPQQYLAVIVLPGSAEKIQARGASWESALEKLSLELATRFVSR